MKGRKKESAPAEHAPRAGKNKEKPSASPAVLRKLSQKKRESVAQLLFKCARLLNERAITRVNQQGLSPSLRPSHTNLLPHLDFEGVRITELSRRLDISKQAVSQSVAELEAQGVVELLVDPADARAKLVRFTKKGADAIAHGLGVLAELESELSAKIGERRMRALHDALLAAEAALSKPT
jgi:DNA-binding MarR family transcriptional regulator